MTTNESTSTPVLTPPSAPVLTPPSVPTDEPVAFNCPRCGSPMYKPAGSSFYWHARNDHPRCDITNIAETAKAGSVVSASAPPKTNA